MAMSGLLHRGGRRTRHLIKEALRSVGPSPELVLEMASLRKQIEANANNIEDLSTRMAALAKEVESFREIRNEFSVHHIPLSDLSSTVVGLTERVHAHEQELRETEREIQRIGGSILDDMALDRRLSRIEDRLTTDDE